MRTQEGKAGKVYHWILKRLCVSPLFARPHGFTLSSAGLCTESALQCRPREVTHVKSQCSSLKYHGTGSVQRLLCLLHGFLLWKPLESPHAFAEGTDSVPSIKSTNRFPGLVTGGEKHALWPASFSSNLGRRSEGCNEHSLGALPRGKQTRTLQDPGQVSSSSNWLFLATTGLTIRLLGREVKPLVFLSYLASDLSGGLRMCPHSGMHFEVFSDNQLQLNRSVPRGHPR